MKKRRSVSPGVLFALCCLSLLSCHGAAAIGGYVVEPGPRDGPLGTPAETRLISPEEYTLEDQVIIFLSANAPFLLWLIPLLFLLKLSLYLGFRKIKRGNVLDNPTRSIIYHYIRESPGADLTGISHETGISENSLRYHLTVLKLMNKVDILETTRNARYYENSGTYPLLEQKVLKHLRNRSTRALIRLVKENPGLSRVQLEAALGLSGAGINWHMHRLSDDGILTIKKEGRNASYDLRPDVIAFLEVHLERYDAGGDV